MKKLALIAFLAAAAATIYAASSQVASAPPGKDNIAFGYGAGYNSTGNNTNVLCIGTDAGANSANNTDCIFIGKNAGKGKRNLDGALYIGSVLGYDGGSSELTIYPPIRNVEACFKDWESIGFVSFRSSREETIFGWNDIDHILYFNEAPYFYSIGLGFFCYGSTSSDPDYEIQNLQSTLDIYARHDKDITVTSEGGSVIVNSNKKMYINADNGFSINCGGKDGAYLAFDGGQLCVYTNGVKAGSLTFTPVAH